MPPIPRTAFLALTCIALSSCEDDPVATTQVPDVVITSPAPGLSVPEGTSLVLSGSATDAQDGPIPDGSLAWSSSIDGPLGTGGQVDVPLPSVGTHTFTLTAVDRDGNPGSAAVSVSVEELAFIDGTLSDPQIGVVVNSLGNAVRLFQVGNPSEVRDIPLGASNAVTPTGISFHGSRAAVPLGNAASVAILDLRTQTIESFHLFVSGNATGSTWTDAATVLAANQTTDVVGKIVVGGGGTVTETTPVAPFPSDVIGVSEELAVVVSANLDDAYAPIGEGIVTAVDPRDMSVIGAVETGGENPQFGALGPDGYVYVVNTGNYSDPGSLAIIDPVSLERIDVVEGFGVGPGPVHVDEQGLVYVSGFFFGTVIWDSVEGAFVRGLENAVCAPLEGGGCRGAFSAYSGSDGSLYQAFFGSSFEGLPPWIFKYAPLTYELVDSIPSGLGPVEIEVRRF